MHKKQQNTEMSNVYLSVSGVPSHMSELEIFRLYRKHELYLQNACFYNVLNPYELFDANTSIFIRWLLGTFLLIKSDIVVFHSFYKEKIWGRMNMALAKLLNKEIIVLEYD